MSVPGCSVMVNYSDVYEWYGVSNHRQLDSTFNRLFTLASNPRITVLWYPLGAYGFPPQWANNAERVSMSWRLHAKEIVTCRSQEVLVALGISKLFMTFHKTCVCFFVLFCDYIISYLWSHINHWPTFLRVASQLIGQSYDLPQWQWSNPEVLWSFADFFVSLDEMLNKHRYASVWRNFSPSKFTNSYFRQQ